jgi:ATP-binding cassette subfamily B protein
MVSSTESNRENSLTRLLGPSSPRLAVAVVAFLVKDSAFWVMPVVTAGVVQIVATGGNVRAIFPYGCVALAVVAVNFPANYLFVLLFSRIVRNLGVSLRTKLALRVQQLSMGFHARSGAGVIQTKVVRDVENVELMLQQGAGPVLSSIGILVGASVVLAIQVPLFLLIFVILVPVTAWLVRWIRQRTDARNEQFRRDVEQFSSSVNEMASLLPITKAHGLEPAATRRVTDRAHAVRASGLGLDLVNGRFGALAWATFQILIVACLLGSAAASLAHIVPITTGQVVLLSTYFVTMTNAIVNLLNLAPLVTRGRESLRSIGELLGEPDFEQNENKRRISAVTGVIRFENVDFHYENASSPTIDGLDLEVRSGETIAFVGASGSGKSTILNLALGFLHPTAGRITLDGYDLRELDLRTVRQFISVVPQDSVLFSGTIRENVSYGLESVPDDVVHAALRDANASNFVEHLPDGWDTMAGERGAMLSGGQRQRISIARALIRDPRILLLDEATSALDFESEQLVQQALDTLMVGRTTLVVAHRLSTIRTADRIVVLESGVAVEIGNHAQLVKRDGIYARMVRAQVT